MLRMVNGSKDDAGVARAPSTGIPDLAEILGAFAAGDVPGLDPLAPGIDQAVAFRPAQNEASLSTTEQPQPACAGKAPVEDMNRSPPPLAQAAFEQLRLFFSFGAGLLPPACPPAHRSQHRWLSIR